MADTDALKPMDEADVSASDAPAPAAPLKEAPEASSEGGTLPRNAADAKQAIVENATRYGQQATDKARTLAEDGKAKAGDALDQLTQLLNDAAQSVDEKLGAQYGGYARQAAGLVSNFSDQVKAKDVDQLVGDVRELVKKSPGIAIGTAAAIGFVIARLVQSGIDAEKA